MRVAFPLAVLLAPLLTAAGLAVYTAAAETRGQVPFSNGRARNAAEAAGMGDAAAVLRFVRRGEDPMRIRLVRPHIISSAVQHVSLLEAAVWSPRSALIEVLDREGVIPDRRTREELFCLARDARRGGVEEYLAPSVGSVQCEAGAALGRIEARN